MQLKRRTESPKAESVPMKRPASSNSTENDGAVEPDEDGITSKRVRANETDAQAS